MATYGSTYNVTVGANGKFAYDPEYVYAAPGDVINFIFEPKNHTVTQSSFEAPCVPLNGGINSGFVPVAPDNKYLSAFQVKVVDDNPVWFHCEQTGHCGAGMVFAINPPPGTFDQFKALAIATGGPFPPPPTVSTTTDWAKPTKPVPVDHKIIVGVNGTLAYSPPNITAAVGDTVTFKFQPKNHTVTQSNFANPCVPLETSTGTVGFFSGFRPVSANATYIPTFQITVNDTNPIWAYCSQTVPVSHCASGMVFAINAPESGPNTFAAFKALAIATNKTSY
ncbi:Cupredoxin [Guyanagaster necrorhizus]|uniref:Cupredoxin n=1 Tax=Guyanagaster necrorhizus TaxID=856835 RepID=A0A9P7VNT0_9AGAR|nr:Cupredoxin [Guyanagaster necrorhizus MCA 3950]KAG7444601.1 Cupredoxin [Guyanagaster necrorhizus MCA 3950]